MSAYILEGIFEEVGFRSSTVLVRLQPFSICISSPHLTASTPSTSTSSSPTSTSSSPFSNSSLPSSSSSSCTSSLLPPSCIAGCNQQTIILMEDILGVLPSKTRVSHCEDAENSQFLHIFWYPRTRVLIRGKEMVKLKSKKIILRASSAIGTIPGSNGRLHLWVNCIRYFARGLAPSSLEKIYECAPEYKKPILFLVNPKSGSGRAECIFEKELVPMLQQSGRSYRLQLTERPNHARELMATEDLSKWAGVVAISGDGLLHEMINGLFEREDWASASQVPIGIIPGGSGNGLARSLAADKKEVYQGGGKLQGILPVLRGETKPMDLVCIETREGHMYSALSIGYALMADVDIESERLRFLGELRFTVWGGWRIANLRLYRAKLSYLPAQGIQTTDQMRRERRLGSMLKRAQTLKTEENTGFHTDETDKKGRDRFFSVSETNYDSAMCDSSPAMSCQGYESGAESDTNSFHSVEEKSNKPTSKVRTPDLGVPSLKEPVPANWKTIEDEFAILYAVSQSHVTSTMCLSPYSTASDGIIWISIIRRGLFPNRKIPRFLLVQYILNTICGDPSILEGVEMIPVKSFRLEPADDKGLLTVDGELIRTGPIQATVLPSLTNILS